jgi:hypothetical protein
MARPRAPGTSGSTTLIRLDGSSPPEQAQQHQEQVGLGEDADQPVVGHHRQAADGVLDQQPGRDLDRLVGPDGDRLG